jgi:hypothetical protein
MRKQQPGVERTMTIKDIVAALAAGEAAPAPVFFSWGVHEGMRGASWLVLNASGLLLERRMGPNARLGEPLPETKLGQIPPAGVQKFAALLVAQNFDQIRSPPAAPSMPQVELTVVCGGDIANVRVPSRQLDQVPELRAIKNAFQALRQQAA